ncbi:hypothetical protein C1H46_025854 [Malus baccata]|uniref:Uncharacterized protein n=1 Tax=Malus baccata TaxID=106549 RepID=A0A540LQ37_MALBA|nr:hypothetical protein C1H46_025854 [Malus baccata]
MVVNACGEVDGELVEAIRKRLDLEEEPHPVAIGGVFEKGLDPLEQDVELLEAEDGGEGEGGSGAADDVFKEDGE